MGKAVRVINLDRNLQRLFRRAVTLSGVGSQSKWISSQIRRLIREQQERFGEDLFEQLTAEEKDVYDVVTSGAAEIQHIVSESLLPKSRVIAILADLIERGYIRESKKGGKTEQARGAVIKLYFPKENKRDSAA